MSNATQFEGRASSSPGMHVGESSANLCDRLSRTRDFSQRQLPTDHDYAVPTREYQTDQSSLKPAPTAACPVLDKRQKQRQRQKQPHRCAGIDGSLHIRFVQGVSLSRKACVYGNVAYYSSRPQTKRRTNHGLPIIEVHHGHHRMSQRGRSYAPCVRIGRQTFSGVRPG